MAFAITKSLRAGVATMLLIAGCAGGSARFNGVAPVGEHSSAIYVYRPGTPVRGEAGPTVVIDGRRDAGLPQGAHLRRELLPGLHIVELRPGAGAEGFRPVRLPLETRRGQTQFIRLSVGRAGGVTHPGAAPSPGTTTAVDVQRRYVLELVEAETAARELAQTRALGD